MEAAWEQNWKGLQFFITFTAVTHILSKFLPKPKEPKEIVDKQRAEKEEKEKKEERVRTSDATTRARARTYTRSITYARASMCAHTRSCLLAGLPLRPYKSMGSGF